MAFSRNLNPILGVNVLKFLALWQSAIFLDLAICLALACIHPYLAIGYGAYAMLLKD